MGGTRDSSIGSNQQTPTSSIIGGLPNSRVLLNNLDGTKHYFVWSLDFIIQILHAFSTPYLIRWVIYTKNLAPKTK